MIAPEKRMKRFVLLVSGDFEFLRWLQAGQDSHRFDPNAPVDVVLPEHGAYTGAFMDFGDEEDDVTLDAIEDFESIVGKHQAIIASSSYWGEQSFPTRNLNVIWRHGALPLRLLVAVGSTL